MRGGAMAGYAILDGFAEAMARLAAGDPLAWTIVGGCVLLVAPLAVAAVFVHRKHKAEAARGNGKYRWKDGQAPKPRR